MIAVCTTLHAYVCDQKDTSEAWLYTAEEMVQAYPDIKFFAAIETDARGLEPFTSLLTRLAEVGGDHWTFQFDDHVRQLSTATRLIRITTGQNLCSAYAVETGATHMLFMAADCEPPGDAIPKLLEMRHPIVGGEVTTYCLSGPRVPQYPFPVEEHMATAAFVMLERQVFNRLRWRCDPQAGMTDDPCLHYDAQTLLGFPTYVRKDVVGKHHPEAIGAIETRGHDMKVYR